MSLPSLGLVLTRLTSTGILVLDYRPKPFRKDEAFRLVCLSFKYASLDPTNYLECHIPLNRIIAGM